jgi:phosphate transport system protein
MPVIMPAIVKRPATGGHIVRAYDRELSRLRELIRATAAAVLEQGRRAVAALLTRDIAIARHVLEREPAIDRLNRETDEEVFLLIARRQPTAADLRLVLAVSKVAGELERAGDKAARIARTLERSAGSTGRPSPLPALPGTVADGIRTLSDTALEMLKQSVNALTEPSLDSAVATMEGSLLLRRHGDALTRVLIGAAAVIDGERLAALLTMAHALERFGNHAANIAEQAVYAITGDDVRHRNRELLIDALRHRSVGTR